MKWADTWEDRISLYADDILLYLASPKSSLTVVLNIFEIFGGYSGYSINWSKSILYVLRGPPPDLPAGCPVQITTEGFKYLGIYIAADAHSRFRQNLLPPLHRLKKDTERWRALPLSLLGRATLFKMMSLPRFLYVLQNSADLVPTSYFKQIETLQRTLLWEGRPRIALAKLHLSWYDGGIGLPDLKKYYWAAHLAAINHGTYREPNDPGYTMDRWLLPGGNYNTALYTKKGNSKLTGPTKHAVQIWHTATRSLGWEKKVTLATPLWDSDVLGNLWRTKGFNKWDLIGISKIGDLWVAGEAKGFHTLQTEYHLATTEPFRYRQIHHALYSCLGRGETPPEFSPLEDRILDGHLPTHTPFP